MDIAINILLWFTTISVGLMAGVYFTFSAFVMRSLDLVEYPTGMLAMQSINRVIVKSSFLPIFFASTLASVALIVLTVLERAAVGGFATLVGSATYVLGMFIVTLVGNVPLNNRLETTPADGPAGSQVWAQYLRTWTIWNHVRTIACIASLTLMVLAISQRF